MFTYNYNPKTKNLYVDLPRVMKFDYEFHNSIAELIEKSINAVSDVEIVLIKCDEEAEFDIMSKAYLLNVLRYLLHFKQIKWHRNLADKIQPNIFKRDGARFREVDISKELVREDLIYYDFHGDKDVQKPVNEMAKILVEKNLTMNSDTVKEFLSTTMGEIFSNSINHSEQDEIFFMYNIDIEDGEFYLSINIIDYGTTIVENVNNYMERNKLGLLNGRECLEWAIRSGNTTREGSGGYGLPTLISYIKNICGELYIFSGNASYRLINNDEYVCISEGLFLGTSITFKVKLFNTDCAIKYDESKEELVSISLDSI